MKRILMMGPPGVGKGTQTALLASRLNVPPISTGDLFREQVARKTELGTAVGSLISTGSYVPDEITNRMVAQRLAMPDTHHGFILDGYPRTTEQVAVLDDILDTTGTPLDAVVILEAPVDEIIERLLHRAKEQGRADDLPEVIARRIQVYEQESADLTVKYVQRGLVHRVTGVGDIGEIAEQIWDAVSHEPAAALG